MMKIPFLINSKFCVLFIIFRCHPAKGQRSGRFEIKDSATVRGDAISAKWIVFTTVYVDKQYDIAFEWYESSAAIITFGIHVLFKKWRGIERELKIPLPSSEHLRRAHMHTIGSLIILP